MYLISEAAAIAGVSARTLHHYDKLGLLVPQKGENGYRYYTDADLDALQSILFYRYLGFPLKEIAPLLRQTGDERLALLEQQLELLEKEERRIITLMETLRKTIRSQKGEVHMNAEEKFTGFKWEDGKEFEDEARRRFGDRVIDAALACQHGREKEAEEAFNRVFRDFAQYMEEGLSPEGAEAQAAAERLLECLRSYSFDCSLEVFGYIGKGYVADSRFKRNIDKFGAGTAQFASDAIAAFVSARA